MPESYTVVALAVVIGRNCRTIRTDAGVTRNELAKYARAAGLHWTASKVGDFESGRNAPTFATVLAATVALSGATRRDVVLADLLEFDDGHIVVTERIVASGASVANAARGLPLKLDDFATLLVELGSQTGKPCSSPADVQARSGVDEYRLARRLGIGAERLAEVSFRLWSRPFSDQRDRLAGVGANQQQRGQVSRKLQAELRKAMADGDD